MGYDRIVGASGPISGMKSVVRETCTPRCASSKRLVGSAGGKPAGAKVRRPVVRIAGWREIKILKPIDKVSLGEATSHRAVTTVNANVASKVLDPRAEPAT